MKCFSGRLAERLMGISLIAGFLFGTVGAMWSFVFVDRAGQGELARLADVKADLNRQIQLLDGIASDYFIANQQGDLIFILAQQGNARQDLAGLIYKGNLLDRATPVRNMLGALAIARQLDYRQSYDAYVKQNDEARQGPHVPQLHPPEGDGASHHRQGPGARADLAQRAVRYRQGHPRGDAAEGKNRLIGLVSAIFGNFLLLVANLFAVIAERNPQGCRAGRGPEPSVLIRTADWGLPERLLKAGTCAGIGDSRSRLKTRKTHGLRGNAHPIDDRPGDHVSDGRLRSMGPSAVYSPIASTVPNDSGVRRHLREHGPNPRMLKDALLSCNVGVVGCCATNRRMCRPRQLAP